jgi:hypothetical protein
MRIVWEIKNGKFGDGVELMLDRALSWSSNRVYRFVNLNARTKHRLKQRAPGHHVRNRGDDWPFP